MGGQSSKTHEGNGGLEKRKRKSDGGAEDIFPIGSGRNKGCSLSKTRHKERRRWHLKHRVALGKKRDRAELGHNLINSL